MKSLASRGLTMRGQSVADLPPIPLATPLPMLCYIIAKAREFDGALDLSDDGSDARPNRAPDIEHESFGVESFGRSIDDTPYDDLAAALTLLNDDQREELVALLWVGRGDYDRTNWRDARLSAAEVSEERELVSYLIGTPLLADMLEEGLTELGHDSEDVQSLPL